MTTLHGSPARCALAVAFLLCARGLPAQMDPTDASHPGHRIEVTRLDADVYLMRAPSELDKWTSSNSVVVVGSTGVVVYDTNALSSTSRLVLDEIRKITDLPVRVVINSHWHMDHWSGNEVYADAFPGLRIISTFETRSFMERMPSPFFMRSAGVGPARERLDTAIETGLTTDGEPASDEDIEQLREDLREREVFEAEIGAIRRVLPNMTFSDSLSFSIDDREFRLYSVTGDASGSAVMYLPDEDILATGDVLVRQESGHGAQPWTINSYAVRDWLEGLRRLESFDAAIIVPGQGPALHDGEYLQTTRELYETLIAGTDAALMAGVLDLDEIRDRIDLVPFRARYALDTPELEQRFEAVVGALIRKIVQQSYDGAVPRY
ncbi:MAG: MBL fold metallo-hydrolase [Gemmatimonadota bacterium]|nr:MBL fold metallo-hydrolase [Gemmatimonadota bacterium]